MVFREFDPEKYSLLLFCQRQAVERLMKALGPAADKVNVFLCPKGVFMEKMATKL